MRRRWTTLSIAALLAGGGAPFGGRAEAEENGPAEDLFEGLGDEAAKDEGAEELEWSRASASDGRRLFRALCAGCHGERGDGNGVAAEAIFPAPRDLTKGEYRFRSTASGQLPLRDDLRRTITKGLPGTVMPAWRDQLDDRAIRSVVLHVETLSPRFAAAKEPLQPFVVEGAVTEMPATPELLTRGRGVFERMKCGDCHGQDGRGDGEAAPTLKDNDGRKSHVFDFSYGVYKGGYRPFDVYRTFMTGLNGTPMPSFADSLPEEADRWALVHYCRSLTRPRGVAFYLLERPTWRDPLASDP